MGGLIVVAIAGGIALAAHFQRRRAHQQKVIRARALAEQHGFHVDPEPKPPPAIGFDLFGVGSSKKVTFQFWRPGSRDSVFDYEYTTGSGKNRSVHRRTCALVSLPFTAPHTEIGPEGFWSGIGRAIGLRDIEVESDRFNDIYRVTGDDERFAIALLDQPMIAWLLRGQSGYGQIRFELRGPWLLCVEDRIDIARHFGFLDWAASVRERMPTVLTSLYPR